MKFWTQNNVAFCYISIFHNNIKSDVSCYCYHRGIINTHLGHVRAEYADVAVLSGLNTKVSQPGSECCSPLLHLAVLQPDVLLIGSATPTKTGPILYIERKVSYDHLIRLYDKIIIIYYGTIIALMHVIWFVMAYRTSVAGRE